MVDELRPLGGRTVFMQCEITPGVPFPLESSPKPEMTASPPPFLYPRSPCLLWLAALVYTHRGVFVHYVALLTSSLLSPRTDVSVVPSALFHFPSSTEQGSLPSCDSYFHQKATPTPVGWIISHHWNCAGETHHLYAPSSRSLVSSRALGSSGSSSICSLRMDPAKATTARARTKAWHPTINTENPVSPPLARTYPGSRRRRRPW